MVVEKFDVATMGLSILFNKTKDFWTRSPVFTTRSFGFHSQNSKNVPNFDTHKTQNYELSWFVKFTMRAASRGHWRVASGVGVLIFLRVACLKSQYAWVTHTNARPATRAQTMSGHAIVCCSVIRA